MPTQLRDGPKDAVRRGWMLGMELVPHVAHFAVFMTGITILYVLLRQKEDGIDIQEIDGAV